MFSFRSKISLLLGFFILSSLSAYLWFGTKLLVDDKLAYLFDSVLTQVKTKSNEVSGLDAKQLVSESGDIEFAFYDTQNKSLTLSHPNESLLKAAWPQFGAESWIEESIHSGLKLGAQQIGEPEWILGWSRIGNSSIVLLGGAPKSRALIASQVLVLQSLFLGLGIFCFAISSSLLISGSVTKPIQRLSLATQKVSVGDFEFQLETHKLPRDEIRSLAESFNLMTQKIRDLLIRTAQNARMETELETAKLVQNSFFPHEDCVRSKIEVTGRLIPASECSGDWWQWKEVGEKVLVIIGDVTGHGASAALLTATAFGAFRALTDVQSLKQKGNFDLADFARDLSHSMHGMGQGQSTMTAILLLIDPLSGEVEWINASHRNPCVWSAEQNKVISWSEGEISSPLGGSNPEIFMRRSKLQKGDLLLLYTDGLVETAQVDQPRGLGLKGLYSWILESSKQAQSALAFRSQMDERWKEWSKSAPLDDDVTYVTVSLGGSQSVSVQA